MYVPVQHFSGCMTWNTYIY